MISAADLDMPAVEDSAKELYKRLRRDINQSGLPSIVAFTVACRLIGEVMHDAAKAEGVTRAEMLLGTAVRLILETIDEEKR